MPFEWNTEKDISNQSKHGFSFDEASQIFNDPNLLVFNSEHSTHTEARLIALGSPTADCEDLLLVVSTFRDGNIRIISAHRPRDKYLKLYLTKSYDSSN